MRMHGSLINKHEVSDVDKSTNALTGNENRVFPINSIGQRDEATSKTHVPKSEGDAALSAAF